jgi:Cys-rich repeat protein
MGSNRAFFGLRTASAVALAGFLGFAGCGGDDNSNSGATVQPQCASDGDCGGNRPYCDTALGRCIECVGNSNCGGGEVCDSVSGSCRATCSTSGDCGQNTPYCAPRGVCVHCVGDGNCSGGQPYCDTTVDRCVECLTSANCSGNQPYCIYPQGSCRECLGNADCGSGQVCNNDYECVSGGCTSDTQCGGDTPYCNTASTLCVECLTNTCNNEFRCTGG